MSASGLMRISLLAAVTIAAVQTASAQHVVLDAPGDDGPEEGASRRRRRARSPPCGRGSILVPCSVALRTILTATPPI